MVWTLYLLECVVIDLGIVKGAFRRGAADRDGAVLALADGVLQILLLEKCSMSLIGQTMSRWVSILASGTMMP